jgi:hypothetical protein
MSIGSIGSSALFPFHALNVRSLAKEESADAPARTPVPQSLSAPADFGGLTVQESHLALRIRSRSDLRTASDGSVSQRSSTKLRFHYDLTTADGQHIELNVKAKVQQASYQDAEGNSVSKTQLKLQFSLLQEGVVDGLSGLQSEQTPGETRSGVSEGLQAFLSAVGDALQQFTEGDSLSADDLVKKTVDTFNTLVDALANLLFPAANEAPPALPVSGESPGEIPLLETPPSDSEPSLLGPPTASPSPAPLPVSLPAEEEVASPAPSATQMLQDVRLRFVQSLTRIIRALTPDEQPENGSLAATQRLIYPSSLNLRIRTASLVDVNA